MTDTSLVVFTPSGKRGRFAHGTTLLQAARALGVDLDSVCGGRGLCGRCQVDVAEGAFAKHGIRSEQGHVSAAGEVEAGQHPVALDQPPLLSVVHQGLTR